MSTKTQRLEIFKYDPVIDAKNTFNITKALNENWDKLDKSITLTMHNMTSTYSLGDWVKDGEKIYKSKQAENTGHATSETDWWEEVELGGEWGKITGDINNQTDLITKLNYLEKMIYPIGAPIPWFNNSLQDNEIWLEGSTVSRTTYAKLFSIYGTTYGAGNGSTTFTLPDLRNRTLWGSTSFGYISAGLPNITGAITNMGFSITGGQIDATGSGALAKSYGEGIQSGSFTTVAKAGMLQYTLDASRSSNLYGNSTTVQPPSIKVRFKTRYK